MTGSLDVLITLLSLLLIIIIAQFLNTAPPPLGYFSIRAGLSVPIIEKMAIELPYYSWKYTPQDNPPPDGPRGAPELQRCLYSYSILFMVMQYDPTLYLSVYRILYS